MNTITIPAAGPRAHTPEAALLARVAAGDREAFTRLAAAVTPAALALAGRILPDRALAEEAVQEALIRLWKEAGRYAPERGAFAAWWRRILVNCAIDARRHLRPVAPLGEADHVADPGAGPEESAARAARARQLEAAMRLLAPRQRAALAMFHGEGCTMVEIAAALETSEKAVEGLLGRARAQLRARLLPLAEDLET